MCVCVCKRSESSLILRMKIAHNRNVIEGNRRDSLFFALFVVGLTTPPTGTDVVRCFSFFGG